MRPWQLVVLASMLVGVAVWVRTGPPLGSVARRHQPRPGQPGGSGGWAAAAVRRLREALPPRAQPAVAELLGALVAELRAGQPTRNALVIASTGLSPPPCPRARRAAELGGDVAAALREDARVPGSGVLRGLAACWEVAEHSGAGLADAVARLAEGHRAARRADEQLAAEVAAVRASARVLALLPVLGLLLGQWIGARPLAWLGGTWPGRIALLVGLGLQALGLAWLHRLVVKARGQLGP